MSALPSSSSGPTTTAVNSCKKSLVVASALLLSHQVGAATPEAHTHKAIFGVGTSNHGNQETRLWGLHVPRGGTDEAPSKGHKNDSENNMKKESKKKKNRNDNSKSKKQNKKDNRRKETKKKNREEQQEESSNEAEDSTNKASTASTSIPSNPMVEEILESEDYYDILGLSRGENHVGRIKKAYRRRAVQTHPDKTGGDRRAFDKLAEAYEVLLDDDKRALYDRYGKAGLDPTNAAGQFGSGGPEDLFRSFFGHPSARQPSQPQGPVNRTLRYQYAVTLEELYKGVTRKVTVEAPPEPTQRFGFVYQEPDAPKKKQVEVNVPRGAFAGQSIRLSGEMDFYSEEAPPGDLIFRLQLRPHKIFTRKGHDLAMTVTISLAEAIGGCTRTIRHLDGRTITIESAKRTLHLPTHLTKDDTKQGPTLDEIEQQDGGNSSVPATNDAEISVPTQVNVHIQTGDVQVLQGQGMPKDPQGTEFGDLYVQYEVEVPKAKDSMEHLTPSEQKELARLLEKLEGKTVSRKGPLLGKQTKTTNNNRYTLEPAKLSDFGSVVPEIHEDEEDHHEQQQQQQFPFHGMGQRQFFFSSTGRSPFFGQETNFEDDENVQCRQM
ncbi:protein DnaJ [Seminavis robusta]|uniref:Protein DnaJ n=1 Tax=Seminavis robusta TaxID=568900 RepID=A0A9N8DPH8_9STRA|nr:protein DnaJ [Seminavis robusta]|eukprot:Sro194_g082900.1 protein DnaJ (605) ;mRNA; r:59681-61495